MLALNDPLWDELEGGYRVKYDPRSALRTLGAGDAPSAWAELWQELHHQGDVGLASYAVVPYLVKIADPNLLNDWNLYALIATIEICRAQTGKNPSLPDAWRSDYEAALKKIGAMALSKIVTASDDDFVASLFAIVAIRKRRHALAKFALMSEEERLQALDELGWG